MAHKQLDVPDTAAAWCVEGRASISSAHRVLVIGTSAETFLLLVFPWA